MTAVLQSLLEWDKHIFFYFQKVQCAFLDYLLGFPTLLGDTVVLLSVTAVMILFLDRKKTSQKITFAVFTILSSYWVVSFLKDYFHRPRPYEFWKNVVLTFGKAPSESFPSGHTAAAFAVAHLLNRLYQGKMPWLYGIAAWVGITRIYTGVHYPTDVVAGAIVGVGCSILTEFLLKRWILLSDTE